MTTTTTTEFNRNEIKRVYSGKPGCGCGCRGKYSTEPKAITRVVNAMVKLVAEGATLQHDGGIFAVETEGRYYWAYTYAD